MQTISNTKQGYIVTQASGTKAAYEWLKAQGYQVTSTANLEHAKDQAPRAYAAYLNGNYQTLQSKEY